LAKLNSKLDRIEKATRDLVRGGCPLCQWRVIIAIPRLSNDDGTPLLHHWPDCFDETGRCRACGVEADRIDFVVPGWPKPEPLEP
jgi:hypothetical protein